MAVMTVAREELRKVAGRMPTEGCPLRTEGNELHFFVSPRHSEGGPSDLSTSVLITTNNHSRNGTAGQASVSTEILKRELNRKMEQILME